MSDKRTFEFTDRALKGLPVPPKPVTDEDKKKGRGQVDYFDTKVRGLGCRVSYGKTKTFFTLYTNKDGQRKRGRLRKKEDGSSEYGQLEHGKLSLAKARKLARVEIGQVAKGRDPAAEARARRSAPTVRQLASDFIVVQRKRGRKSASIQQRRLERAVLPILGDYKARDVSRADIKNIMNKISERGAPIEANRVHEVIRTMLNYGLEEEVYGLETNPADRLGKHRNPEQGRDRWLTTEEIGAYWTALDVHDHGPAAALRLCLLTAQRQQNVLGMRLDQLALVDRLWIVPAGKTKTNRSYKVPLSTAAVGIIEARIAEIEDVTWLFPKRGGGDGPAGLTFTGKAHRSACKRAGIADYTPHDHRHTYATHMEQMGISRLIWDPILGHSGNAMADLYSGFDFAEQRLSCMEKWADRIAAALGDNVVNLDRSREKPG